MKIFGLFGKPAIRHVRHPQASTDEQALATSKKIDSIESEISAEYAHANWPFGPSGAATEERPPTLSQCLDEAALLYANHETDSASALLSTALALPGEHSERLQAWWMLFEIALAECQPEHFEALALDYATRFEASPPQWRAPEPHQAAVAQTLPVVHFRGKLCGSGQPALQQLQQLGLRHRQFSLDVNAITDIDIEGCQLFLQVLANWQEQRCSFRIADGAPLAEAVHGLIQAGRRDSDDSAWRLAMEWMRLLRRDDDYEALCIDYCVTYEVSPPVATLTPPAAPDKDSFVMPECIALPVDRVLAHVEQHARQTTALVLDCAALLRVEFSAAMPLLQGLHRIAAGKTVECRDVSFLVSRLLHLVGGKAELKIINRKP